MLSSQIENSLFFVPQNHIQESQYVSRADYCHNRGQHNATSLIHLSGSYPSILTSMHLCGRPKMYFFYCLNYIPLFAICTINVWYRSDHQNLLQSQRSEIVLDEPDEESNEWTYILNRSDSDTQSTMIFRFIWPV